MKKPNKANKTIKETTTAGELRRGFSASAFVKRTVIKPDGSDITFNNGCIAHCDTFAEVENLYQKLTDLEELVTECPQGSNDGEYADDYGDRADESKFIEGAGAFMKRRVESDQTVGPKMPEPVARPAASTIKILKWLQLKHDSLADRGFSEEYIVGYNTLIDEVEESGKYGAALDKYVRTLIKRNPKQLPAIKGYNNAIADVLSHGRVKQYDDNSPTSMRGMKNYVESGEPTDRAYVKPVPVPAASTRRILKYFRGVQDKLASNGYSEDYIAGYNTLLDEVEELDVYGQKLISKLKTMIEPNPDKKEGLEGYNGAIQDILSTDGLDPYKN